MLVVKVMAILLVHLNSNLIIGEIIFFVEKSFFHVLLKRLFSFVLCEKSNFAKFTFNSKTFFVKLSKERKILR